ncbi:MAG: hypothetical protein DHS20C18_51750 [Saprospiraceae bacterium]|nr:MAG: hypothetical protein DHS20C18_51750 [Saprospiraceae bacterium]
MKKIIPLLLILFGVGIAWGQRCLSETILKEKMENDPEVAARRIAIEANRQIPTLDSEITSREVVTIQVVVHVVYFLPIENISDAQIQSQIDVLNEDFRLQNANANIVTLPEFASKMADMEIEFQLADTDPDGQPTNGITRTHTLIPNIALKLLGNLRLICYTELGGQDAWCPDRYLNIWVGKFPVGFAGDTSFPGQDEPEEDGVRIDPYHFGRTGIALAPFNLGRTLTHEIGHYFDLQHTWGNCITDDGIEDTPWQKSPYSGCPSGWNYYSCDSRDMYVNYMDYTDDACMAMFTLEQKQRLMATLNGPRSGLLTPTNCGTVSTVEAENWFKGSLFPNPTNDQLFVELPFRNDSTYELEFFDMQGKHLGEKFNLDSGIHELDITMLGSGVYFVKITQGKHYMYKKVVVQ